MTLPTDPRISPATGAASTSRTGVAESGQGFINLLSAAIGADEPAPGAFTLSDTAALTTDAAASNGMLSATPELAARSEEALPPGETAPPVEANSCTDVLTDIIARIAGPASLVASPVGAPHFAGVHPTEPGDVSDDDKDIHSADPVQAELSALLAMLPAGGVTAAAKTPVSAPQTTHSTLPSAGKSRLTVADSAGGQAPPQDVSAANPAPPTEGSTPRQHPFPILSPGNTDPAGSIAPVTPVHSATGFSASANAPTPVVTIASPPGSPAWQQSVSQHITLFTRQGQHSAELRLHPEDLGQVSISLKVDDNQLQLQMISGHSHVRAALEAALPQLRTQLAESGFQLTQSDIGSNSFSQQQQSPFHSPGNTGGGNARAEAGEESERLSVPDALQRRADGSSAVDIFA